MSRTILLWSCLLALAAAGDCADTLRLAPPPGNYPVVVPVMSVTRVAADERLVHTLDGTPPDATSWSVHGPILLTDSTNLRVAVIGPDGAIRRSVQGSYVINGALSTARPVASPGTGTYAEAQQVTLVSATPGAVIHYTTDGSEPTCASPRYSGPLSIATDTVLHARAMGGFRQVAVGRFTVWVPMAFPSGVMTERYTIRGQSEQVAQPVIAPASGTYHDIFTATATTATSDAQVRYRLDGGDPGASDPLWPADGMVIDRSLALSVRGFRDGWLSSPVAMATYALQVAVPTASLPAGRYVGDRSVTLSCTSPGVAIHYTVDGSTPDATSPVAATPVVLPGSCVLRAIARRDGWQDSSELSVAYLLEVPAPTLTPGTMTSEAPISVTASGVGMLRYTDDGTDPNAESPELPVPFVVQRSLPLTVIGTRIGWEPSVAARATYTLIVPAPVLSPPAGTSTMPIQVTATTAASGAELHYTLDGSLPTALSPVLPADGVPLAAPAQVAVIATRIGWTDSVVVRGDYAFQVAAPTWNHPPDPAVGSVAITASTTTPDASLRYTVDGSDPTEGSPSLPVTLTETSLVTVRGFRAGWQASPPLSAVWTVTPTVAFAVETVRLPVTAGQIPVVLRLSGRHLTQDVRLTLNAVDGTARWGTDLALSSMTVVVPMGSREAQVLVQALPVADRPTVAAILDLTAADGAVLGTPVRVTITIPAPEPPPVFTTTRSPLARVPAGQRFDAERWATEPVYREAYLALAAPERLWDQVPGATGQVRITGSARLSMPTSGGSLQIQAPALSPVTLLATTTDVVFANGATVVTVQADADGRATIPLTGRAGGGADVMIGCPLARQVVRCRVDVAVGEAP